MVSVSRRRVLVGLGGAAGAMGTGVAYQAIGAELDRREYPPPGQLVDVGGHRLHLDARGEPGDAPTVVIEAGAGGWTLDWRRVQVALADTTRVVAYDRAGYGWSESGPAPRTAARIVDELRAALGAAGIDGPYVLVGHSLGGYTPRLLADEDPSAVAGIVLIDALQEDVNDDLPPDAAGQTPPLGLLRLLSRLGVVRLLIDLMGADAPGLPPSLKELPREVRETYLAIGFQPAYFRAVADENAAIEESDAQVRRSGPLGDTPLTVLSHDVPDMFAGLPEETARTAERVWQDGQRELAALSSEGSRHVVENAGHNVQYDRPDAVIRSIREMVETVRRR